MAMLFEMAGHQVRVAYGGNAALAAADDFRPDVAFVDIGMPDISGYQVAQTLGQRPYRAELRLVALSGYGRQDDQIMARDAGFDLHLTKPAGTDRLLAIATDKVSHHVRSSP